MGGLGRGLPFLVIGTFNGMKITVSMNIDGCMLCCGCYTPIRKLIFKRITLGGCVASKGQVKD